jgi:AcrR family transcriptional regulator
MTTRGIPTELLTAAARLIDAHGVDAFTMDDLARAARVSRATVYRRARSREAVLDALRARGAPIAPTSDTRERILAAARVVFGRAGFEAATIDDIATEAGVALATVYRHFGDKDGVVAAFIEDATPRRTAREVSMTPTGDLRADLERFATRMISGVRRDEALMRLLLIETLRGSEYIARMRALSPTRTLAALVRLLQPHAAAGRLASRDLEDLAQAFSGMLFSFALIGPLMRGTDRVDPERSARFVTDLFLRGAIAGKEKRR